MRCKHHREMMIETGIEADRLLPGDAMNQMFGRMRLASTTRFFATLEGEGEHLAGMPAEPGVTSRGGTMIEACDSLT